MPWPAYEDYAYWKNEMELHWEKRRDEEYPQDYIGGTPCDGECNECIKECWEE